MTVQNYFRNHPKAIGLLKELGGVIPQLPNETRWTSQRACYDTFLRNLPAYFQISNQIDMLVNVCNLIRNIGLKNEAENLLAILNKITTVLNVVQSDSTDLGTAVVHWLQLTEDESLPVHVRDSLKKRFEGATTFFHLIAYELTKADGDPNISGKTE